MSIFIFIILALILILLIVLFAYFYKRFPSQKEKTDPLVIKTEQIINDANENAEKIIKDAQLLSGKINEVYNNLSQKFEIEVANMYDRKIKELESNIKIKETTIDDINQKFITNLEETVNNLNSKSENFKSTYDKLLSDFEHSLNMLFQDISEKTQNNLSNFSKMNLELYDKDLQEIEDKTTQIINEMVSDEKAKFSALSDQIKEESDQMRQELINSLNKDAALVIARVVKEVLNLSISLEGQEEYIFDVLNKHIDEIKNGL
jgi:exonuclease VII large subunit